MKTISTLTISVLLVTAMSACNNAKSPDAVANDVATAEQQAATKVSDAQKSAAKSTDSAETTVDEKTKDLNSAEAKGAYDVASAKADGDHNVAIEKCNAWPAMLRKPARIRWTRIRFGEGECQGCSCGAEAAG